MKTCDHTSVGLFVWKEGKILLIERKRPPYGLAVPAGHVDQDKSFEEAAKRELREETGLETIKLELLAEGRKDRTCRREDGNWHYWKLYKAETKGKIKIAKDEVKKIGWYSVEEIRKLAERTEKYLRGEIDEKEWQENPGLEVVMNEWFREIEIV